MILDAFGWLAPHAAALQETTPSPKDAALLQAATIQANAATVQAVAAAVQVIFAFILVWQTIRSVRATVTIAAENRAMTAATAEAVDQARRQHQDETLPIIVFALLSRDGSAPPTVGDLAVERLDAGRGPALDVSFDLDTPGTYRIGRADPPTLPPLALAAGHAARFHYELRGWAEEREIAARFNAAPRDQVSATYSDVLGHRYRSSALVQYPEPSRHAAERPVRLMEMSFVRLPDE